MSRKKNPESRRRKRKARWERERGLSLQEVILLRQSNAIASNSGNMDIVGRSVYKPTKTKKFIFNKTLRESRKTWIRRLRLVKLSGEQNHRCCYCGQVSWHPEIDDGGTVKHTKHNRATIEHVVPFTHGGTWGKHNLVMACSQCNNARGAKSLEYFVALITTTIKIPLSLRSKQINRRANGEPGWNGKKGRLKKIRTFNLLVVAAVFTPELFEIVLTEFGALRLKMKTKIKWCSITAIRKRVIENSMVF